MAENDDKNPPEDKKPDDDGRVPKEHAEKLKREKDNYKSALDASKTALDAANAKLKELTEGKLKEAGNWEELLKNKETELAQLRTEKTEFETKLNLFTETQTKNTKLGAVRKEFEKLGADPKSMDFLLEGVKLDAVKFDDEHKVVMGAENEAKRIKERLPQVFGKHTPGGGHDAPDLGNHKLTPEEYAKLPLAEKKKREADVWAAAGVPLTK